MWAGGSCMSNTKLNTNYKDKDWRELCEYVHDVVLEYDSNQSLSKFIFLRLRGMATNKYIANNKIESNANYSYTVILNTFKFCKLEIERAKQTVSFKSEQHKFNYFCTIVESKINDVYNRMRASEKAIEKSNTIDFAQILNEDRANYQSKNNTNTHKFDDMW